MSGSLDYSFAQQVVRLIPRTDPLIPVAALVSPPARPPLPGGSPRLPRAGSGRVGAEPMHPAPRG